MMPKHIALTTDSGTLQFTIFDNGTIEGALLYTVKVPSLIKGMETEEKRFTIVAGSIERLATFFANKKENEKVNISLPDTLMTAEDAAKFLSISERVLRNLSQRGDIPGSVHFNGKKCWDRAELTKFLLTLRSEI